MGKVMAKVRMWNYSEEEKVKRGEVEPLEVEALVDTGSMSVVLPTWIVERLGLLVDGEVPVVFADGHKARRDLAWGLRIETLGRSTELRAIVEPGRDTPLLGQLFLEDTCLLVDCKSGKLVPDPAYGGEEVHEVI
ncbi:MAG: aspartyl protease family protein [Planctomycetes bacterium]|nr:aspartyl protease family protein [Planctomycetota bacterium]